MPRQTFFGPIKLLIMALAVTGVGCASKTVVSETPVDSKQPATPARAGPPANWYATAMQRHAPLGRIPGNLTTAPPVVYRGDQFAHVVSYAQQQDSYAVLVWHNDALVLEHYFDPYDKELRPESASMHKSVLALAIGAAITDGAIDSADDRIGKYIERWRDDPRGDITLRQLLTMSSGLKPLGREGGRESESARFWLDGANARATVLGLSIERAAGSGFSYQDTVSQLLLIALEAATGVEYERYLSERIWKRIGAADAFVWRNEPDGFPRANTALMARARDWLRVGRLVKDRGRFDGVSIIDPDVIKDATTPSPTNPNYGWQMWLGTEYQQRRFYAGDNTGTSFAASAPYNVDDWVFFDGFGGQRVYISAAQNLVIVRSGALQMEWDDAMLPNLVIDAINERQIQRTEVTLDAGDGRTIPLRVFSPSEGCNACTLVFFSHGAGLSHESYTPLLSHWVRKGYVVAAPLHVDSQSHPSRNDYNGLDWVRTRVADYHLVTHALMSDDATVEGVSFSGALIAAGHSFGALTAQIAGGATLDPQIGVHLSADAISPLGVIALSPPGPIDNYIAAAGWAKIDRPMLVVTGTNDTIENFTPQWTLHMAAYDAAPAGSAYGLVFEDIDHYFNGAFGRPNNASFINNPEVARLNAIVVDFFAALETGVLPTSAQWRDQSDTSLRAMSR
ncbi:MAG: serine hydrolase [Pseudomonadota bacterium]